MPEPLRLQGISASAGYAEGPLFNLDRGPARYTGKATAGEEKAALEAAIASATDRLATLIETADGEAAGILEFQLAMLEDEALTGPAFAAIPSGIPADMAWRQALDAEIAGYETSDQDYFRARAADMRDIRDRVLRALTDEAESAARCGELLIWSAKYTRTRLAASSVPAGPAI